MKDCLILNGKEIELTEEQIAQIKQSFNLGDIQLSTISEGDIFKIGEYEFILLEKSGDTAAVILKDLLYESKKFGSNNNYDGSDIDKLCVEFSEVIQKLVGAENLVEHTVDLTSDDGLKCYGTVKRKMSLITAQMYRKYVYTLDEHLLKKWWWLATAYSTAKHDDTDWVKCVSPHGGIGDVGFCISSRGVRPFCILKSNIFVSK